MENSKIIALVGKGGVGKTTLSSAFVRVLSEKYSEARILAIDADPAVGLSTALGIQVKETLDDIRRQIIETAENGSGQEAIELLGEARFRIFDTLIEDDRFAFLAIGRPEGAGCYCTVNAYLKEVIEMVSRDFDYVVIDGEAGIEQINRRVMEKVSHLILVSDASRKGTKVIETIRSVADELVMYEKCGAIINRIEDLSLAPYIKVEGTEILSIIPADNAHAINDIMGKSIFELCDDAPVLKGAREALEKMGI
ncbi:MAG: AAA family ATPase [Holdemanella sp.]|nr:AAA family ATPase [Holdemanella sp.]